MYDILFVRYISHMSHIDVLARLSIWADKYGHRYEVKEEWFVESPLLSIKILSIPQGRANEVIASFDNFLRWLSVCSAQDTRS